MATRGFDGQVFTVRPDRVDFRDFPYRAPLRNLPKEYPDLDAFQKYVKFYFDDGMILQQGKYGACTGFGLAGVINYLKWEEARLNFEAKQKDRNGHNGPIDEKLWKKHVPSKVSESMLYLNARLYDEWPGDDYQGSSCRGAMKGWHKHGVCSSDAWPYRHGGKDGPGKPSDDRWRSEATEVVLGAYYRIDQTSIVDMQAAIYEIHAIYAAAEAHAGWTALQNGAKTWDQAVILPPDDGDLYKRGGHAFAIVGYTQDGFIVQNSWGPTWGYHGFALLPYTDWVEYGYDAWALALGAPIASRALPASVATAKVRAAKIEPTLSPVGFSDLSLQERVRAPAGWSLAGIDKKKREPELPKGVSPWSDDDVTHHVIVSTVDGAPVRQMPVAHSAAESVQLVARKALQDAQDNHCNDLAIVLHGGLNSKEDGLVRAGFMGPWFLANRIVPVFPIWQTDGGTSLLHAAIEALGLDELAKWIVARGPSARPDDNALDRHVEDVARHSPGKAAWSEMKNKAEGLSAKGGALRIFIEEIAKAANPPAVHIIGHSAGAIVAGYALAALKRAGLATKTISLYAPACTADFANTTFGLHLKPGGYLKSGSLHIDYLTDRRERLDPCVSKLGVTLYSKSLLYLVSRAFEAQHKTPILGLERTLTHDREKIVADDAFHVGLINGVTKWQATMKAANVGSKAWDQDRITVTVRETKTDFVTEPNLHGAFDNNVDCVDATIARILGLADGKTPKPVKDLNYGGG